MEQYLRELYCSRIIVGYIKYNEYRIYWPDKETLYESCEVYKESYEDAKTEGLLTVKELKSELIVSSLLDANIDSDIKSATEQLDNLKVNYYKSMGDTKAIKRLRSQIEVAKARILKLLTEEQKYNHLTCEGVASFAKWAYILENSTYVKNQRADNLNIFSLLEHWNVSRLTDDQLREIARTEPWQSYWQAKTASIFGKPDCELNDEQRRLIIWTKMYDSIRESMEAPPDEVIQDDDALDGWMIIQRRKREKDKKSKEIDSRIKSDKIRNAQDIFIPVKNAEQAKEIDALNDENNQMFKKMRLGQVQKSGTVDAKDLKDIHARKLMK
jgi:hypothetical protein